jgi:nucleotide-binding universal stress UspA family protein
MRINSFQRILLATDGSKQAESAAGIVALLARGAKASVRVVHVWNLEVHHRHGVWDVETRSEAESLINEAVLRLRASGIDARGGIMHADSNHVGSAIAEAARELSADLVVVGSRGLSDWQAMLKHSVSHQLLGKLDCPVLIARAQLPPSHRGLRILLAVAGGDDVEPGVRAAAAAAHAPGSEVLVVHVPQVLIGTPGYVYIEPREEISRTMSEAAELLNSAGVKVQAMVAEAGPVAEVVPEIAAGWRADVIVTGSSRIGDLGSLLLGSVTHDLLRTNETPVLVAERSKS